MNDLDHRRSNAVGPVAGVSVALFFGAVAYTVGYGGLTKIFPGQTYGFDTAASTPVRDTVELFVVEMAGSGVRLVSQGLPLSPLQLAISDTGNVSFWADTTAGAEGLVERPIAIKVLARHLDTTYVRSLGFQWTGDPDSIVSAEVRFGVAAAVAHVADSTPWLANPDAQLLPSRKQLIASGMSWFDVDTTPHADLIGFDTVYLEWTTRAGQATAWSGNNKYRGGTALLSWLVRYGPTGAAADTVANMVREAYELVDSMNVLNKPNYTQAEFSTNGNDPWGLYASYLLTGHEEHRVALTRAMIYQCADDTNKYENFAGGGRALGYAAGHALGAILLDADTVTHPTATPAGPFSKSAHMSNYVDNCVREFINGWTDAQNWSTGDPSMPVDVNGLWNEDGGINDSYSPGGFQSYQTGMGHHAVMLSFRVLDDLSAIADAQSDGLNALGVTLDSLRDSLWIPALLNVADIFTNDTSGMSGYDATSDTWFYAGHNYLGDTGDTLDWRWNGAEASLGTPWSFDVTSAAAGTNTTTIVFSNVSADLGGDTALVTFTSTPWVYNRTRSLWSVVTGGGTGNNDTLFISPAITGQTSTDAITVLEYDYDSPGQLSTTFQGWYSLMANSMLVDAWRVAPAGELKTRLCSAWRTALVDHIARIDNTGGGTYYVYNNAKGEGNEYPTTAYAGWNANLSWLAEHSDVLTLDGTCS